MVRDNSYREDDKSQWYEQIDQWLPLPDESVKPGENLHDHNYRFRLFAYVTQQVEDAIDRGLEAWHGAKERELDPAEYLKGRRWLVLDAFDLEVRVIKRFIRDEAVVCPRSPDFKAGQFYTQATDILSGLRIHLQRAYEAGTVDREEFCKSVAKWDDTRHMLTLVKAECGSQSGQTDDKRASVAVARKQTGKAPLRTLDERKFRPWQQPGDACFILDQDGRVRLHHDGRIEDLGLKSHSKALDLITYLAAGRSLTSGEVKELCSPGTKPCRLVLRANQTLNNNVPADKFPRIPKNTAFIGYDPKRDRYFSCLPIHPSMDDFNQAETKAIVNDD